MQSFHPKRLLLALVAVAFGAPALQADGPWTPPAPMTQDALVDRHALAAPPEAEQSLDALAAYLAQPARSDRDKARAIFRWMTDRVRFDLNAHLTGNAGETRPEVVLRDREATSFGYAPLFDALARRAGLDVVTVHGYAKLKHFTEEGRLRKVKHAWNAVKIDGAWQLVDTACGAGIVKHQRWQRLFQEQYFLTPATQMIYTHLPLDPRCQLLSQPISPAQFDALPPLNARFLHFGIKHETSLQHAAAPQARGNKFSTSTQLLLQAGKVKVLHAPSVKTIPAGSDCYFLIEAPDVAQMAVWNDGQWYLMHKYGTRFEGLIRPQPGEMRLCLQRPRNPEFQSVITYKVHADR